MKTYSLYYGPWEDFYIAAEHDTWAGLPIVELIYNVENEITIIKYQSGSLDVICDSVEIVRTYTRYDVTLKHLNALKSLKDGYDYACIDSCGE